MRPGDRYTPGPAPAGICGEATVTQGAGSTEHHLAALAAAQERTQVQIEALTRSMELLVVRMERMETQIERLVEAVLRLGDRVGGMRGTVLEIEYRTKAPAY